MSRLTWSEITPFSFMKSLIMIPTLSSPNSERKSAGTPHLPREIMELNVDPPGTAACGWLFRNTMSRTVSPIPIAFLISLNVRRILSP